MLAGGGALNGDETLLRKRIGPGNADRSRIAAQMEGMDNFGEKMKFHLISNAKRSARCSGR